MLEKYIDEQPLITTLLLNSIKTEKIVQAYLFVLDDMNYLMNYALSFSKMLISDNDDSINKLIDDNNYPEIKIINPVNDIIKKEDLNTLQKDFQVKPILGKKLIYIINGADKLNSSSANTILKFLEEPSDDIVAILLTNNLTKVLPTIKSRCQILLFESNNKNKKRSFKDFYDEYKNNNDISEESFNTIIENSIKIIEILEKININMFFHFKSDITDLFIKKEEYVILFDFMLYFYYDMLNYSLKRDLLYINDYIDYIEKTEKSNDINSIAKKISIIEDIKQKLNTNMNIKLLLDNFIIRFSEV